MTTEPCANAMERDPSYADDNLIWIDMEMTGLQPEVNRVLEVAAIITDKNLNILHEGPVVAIHQPKAVLTGWMLGIRKRILNPDLLHDALKVRWMKKNARRYSLRSFAAMCQKAKAQCAAIRSVRTAVLWRAGFPAWSVISTIARLTCQPSRNSAAGGLRKKFGSELVSTSIKPLRILRKVFMNFLGIGRKYFVSN